MPAGHFTVRERRCCSPYFFFAYRLLHQKIKVRALGPGPINWHNMGLFIKSIEVNTVNNYCNTQYLSGDHAIYHLGP